MNSLVLAGRLAADPEPGRGSTPQARLRIAVDAWNPTTKTREPDFMTVVAFGRTAETALKYTHKGSYVIIRGKVKPRSWTAGDGTKRHELSIVVDELELGPKNAGGVAAAPIPWESEPGSVHDTETDPFSFE